MNWTDILKTLAPTVASAALGPLGGMAITALGAAIGIDAPTREAVEKAFTAGQLTPEAVERIKSLELDYQNQEKERGFRFAELEFKTTELIARDRDSARGMQIATHSKMPAALTIMVTIGFFGVLTALLRNPELKANEIVLVMVGQLSAVWGACVAFYVSTTFSSANKNQLLAQAGTQK
ncbi:MAG: hypothetical protein U5L73_11340 [Rhodoferax sp.]|uniref:hypothetical protein n=1 Tax=Rhodoferax sp. TaxID=50421 RepID=UPI002ACE7FD7|nr:hypothetical protein [Rhodoferax sp.]MDZ7892336.1 hypothetical protein [Rhodoferax sp.]